jgi:hypothetical protein
MRADVGGRLRLSILDHTPVSSGSTLGEAFWHSTRLASPNTAASRVSFGWCSIGANSRDTRGYYTCAQWQDYVIGGLKINSLLEGAALPALRRNVNAEKR